MRLDVLLFELRLFKSRSQARASIDEGSALLNGTRAKPSQSAVPGDRVTLVGPHGSRTVEVLEMPHGSQSKQRARQLVREIGGAEPAGDGAEE